MAPQFLQKLTPYIQCQSWYVMSRCVTSSPVASCHVTLCHCKRRHIISRHTSPCQPHCTFAWRYILHVTLWSNLHGNGYWFSCGLHHLYCPFRFFYISKELKRKGTFLRDLPNDKVIKSWYERESQHEIQTQSLKIAANAYVLTISLTLCTITSVCIFSILFSKHFLRCWQGEFV